MKKHFFLLLLTVLCVKSLSAQEEPRFYINAVAWSPDGKYLAVGTSEGVQLFDMSGDTPKRYWQAETEQSVSVVVFSPSGTQLAAGQGNGSMLDAGFINVWNMPNGELITSFLANTFAVSVLGYSPDGRILASGGGYSPTRMGGDYDVGLWDTTTWEEARESPGRGVGMVTSIVFSSDGQYFFFGSRDGPIHIMDTQDWEPVTSIHETGVSWTNYLSEDQQLVLGYYRRVEIWTLHHEPEIYLTRRIIWDDTNGKNISEFLNGEFVIDCETDLLSVYRV